jgi:hypothetical protein
MEHSRRMTMIPTELFESIVSEKSPLDMDIQKLLSLKLAPDVKLRLLQQVVGKNIRQLEEARLKRQLTTDDSADRKKLIDTLVSYIERLKTGTASKSAPPPPELRPLIEVPMDVITEDQAVEILGLPANESTRKRKLNADEAVDPAKKSKDSFPVVKTSNKPTEKPAGHMEVSTDLEMRGIKRAGDKMTPPSKRQKSEARKGVKRLAANDESPTPPPKKLRPALLNEVLKSMKQKAPSYVPTKRNHHSINDDSSGGAHEPELKYIKLDISKRPSERYTLQPPKRLKRDDGSAPKVRRWMTFKL